MEHKLDELSIANICRGAVAERFEREVRAVLANIRDANTKPDQKRKITLSFTFTPFADRSGAEVTFGCESKHAAAEEVQGTIYISAISGEVKAYPRDPRQEALFTEPASNQKQ